MLKTDKLDLVILNTAKSPELRYNIIFKGKLIYVIDPYNVIAETQILNEYFDYRSQMKKYHLTKAAV